MRGELILPSKSVAPVLLHAVDHFWAVMKKSRAKSHFFVILSICCKYFQCFCVFLIVFSCLSVLGMSAGVGESFCFCFAVWNGQIGCCYWRRQGHSGSPTRMGRWARRSRASLNMFNLLSRILLFCSKAALVNSERTVLYGKLKKTTCCKTNHPHLQQNRY